MATIRANGIFWEASDREAIIKNAYAFVRAKGITVPFERGSILLDVVEYAQRQSLDKQFHRPMTNSTTYLWVQEGIIEMLQKQTEDNTPVDNATLNMLMPLSSLELSEADKQEIERKLRDTNSSMWSMIQEEVRKSPVIVSLVDSLAEMLADDIMATVQKRLMQQAPTLTVPVAKKEEVKPEPVIRKEEPVKKVKIVVPAPPERVKKHLVVLTGLLDADFARMEQEFGDVLDLRRVGVDNLRQTVAFDNANQIYVMSFTNHKITNYLKKKKKPYVFVSNGFTFLRSLLNKYIKDHNLMEKQS